MASIELPILPFHKAARAPLNDAQLRKNLGKATHAIRAKRISLTEELPDWEALREAGSDIKADVMRNLDRYLLQLERAVTAAGGQVHWAADASEANRIVSSLVIATGSLEVIKVKSMTTEEIRLNDALKSAGVSAIETDLAELIIQLAGEPPSHILVPAIHKNRAEIRELLVRTLGETELSDEPAELAGAARRFLREKFLLVKVGISGANFAIAETGSVCVVESEGNGRMCLTLPETLITVMGIEKPAADLGRLRRLLATFAPFLHGRAHESLHQLLDGRPRGRRAQHLSPRSLGQRAHRRTQRRSRASGASLYSLQRLSKCLPDL